MAVCSLVAKELGQRRQAQVRSLSPPHCTPGNRSSASGWGRSDEGGHGYHSDPGSSQSDQSMLSLAQSEPQSLNSVLIARVEKLEKQHVEQERKLKQLETLCFNLETSNMLLHEALDDKSSCIEKLEKQLEDQKNQLLSVEQHLDVSKVAMENQNNAIKKLETAMQQLRSTSTGGQAPPPNLDLTSISSQIGAIEGALMNEFSSSFGSENRQDKLDTLLSELKSKVDNLYSGRSQSPPHCTPWQHWKSEACTIIGTSKQGQKSTREFRCYDDNCDWKDKCVTLNAYINHLKREPHKINISTNPDLRWLPKV